MYLTALTQRDRLFDISTRWLNGVVQPDDGRLLTEIFLLDHLITGPKVIDFLREVAAPIGGGPMRIEHLRTKDQLRRRIMAGRPQQTDRVSELFSAYSNRSEQYFPATPVDLYTATRDDGALVAMTRFKRLMRIADKAARKITGRVRREARNLPPANISEAEDQVCRAFEAGRLVFTSDELAIDDVVGAKLIGDEQDLARIEKAIDSHPDVLSLQRKEHNGRYNDVRFTVELPCPPPATSLYGLLDNDWSVATERGLEPGDLRRSIPDYVGSGAASFSIEIILTTWEELVESEFGRGLHEERILSQRVDPRYAGQLVVNASLACSYLMLVAISPTVTVTETPVKMSGRYLPDLLAGCMGQLFGLSVGCSPLYIPEAGDAPSILPAR